VAAAVAEALGLGDAVPGLGDACADGEGVGVGAGAGANARAMAPLVNSWQALGSTFGVVAGLSGLIVSAPQAARTTAATATTADQQRREAMARSGMTREDSPKGG
jgi:hypothetical protein